MNGDSPGFAAVVSAICKAAQSMGANSEVGMACYLIEHAREKRLTREQFLEWVGTVWDTTKA